MSASRGKGGRVRIVLLRAERFVLRPDRQMRMVVGRGPTVWPGSHGSRCQCMAIGRARALHSPGTVKGCGAVGVRQYWRRGTECKRFLVFFGGGGAMQMVNF